MWRTAWGLSFQLNEWRAKHTLVICRHRGESVYISVSHAKKHFRTTSNQIKSNQITFIVTSPQHKCLGEWNSCERAPDSAEKQQTIYLWTDSAKKTTNNLHMDRQCKKNNKQFTYGQTVQKKKKTIYIWTDSAKKTTNNLHMDRQCKKTTAIYIWTVHIYRLYRRQCAKYTYIYSVHIVYYRDILNYQRHIIHRMYTSTLCTLSIHNVVYT